MRTTPNWPGWREPERIAPFAIPNALKPRTTCAMVDELYRMRLAAGVCRHCGGPVPCWSPEGDVRVGVTHGATRV
ncbi:MAG TPA: hypothetical protein VLK36_08880 [Gaiellaceae bacterium]|nr:hypothetical protein [Gaiellaceae bacterium]